MRLAVTEGGVLDLLDLVEDLALHDWLLSTVETELERARLGSGPMDKTLRSLRPLVDHVLHHWMPGARVRQDLLPLWNSLDRVHGLTRQWDISVNRVRDQLSLSTITMLSSTAGQNRNAS